MRLPRATTPTVAAVLALALGMPVLPAAADPDRPSAATGARPVPTLQQVQRAQDRVADRSRDVGAIQAGLALADQRLRAASVRAEQASEAYNGALWRLERARAAYRAAHAEAARARRTVAVHRDRMGAWAAGSYRRAGELTALSAVVGADGPSAVLEQYAAFQGAASSLQADHQRFVASDSLARVFEARARRARLQQAASAERARRARSAARSAAQAAQAQASAVSAKKDRLVRELASAQHVSLTLARSRQAALAELAQQRAADSARSTALAQARARARGEYGVPAPQAARSGSATSPATGSDEPGRAAPSGGASSAIAFAEAQLGERYRWGAAGPGSWDCSGLTMMAWASAGRSLPHYSVAQYSAGTPISVSDLRPGDLVFWSANGAPSGIHHVAMYIGAGRIIHAPRTGRPVSVDSMYYWVPPDLFVRV